MAHSTKTLAARAAAGLGAVALATLAAFGTALPAQAAGPNIDPSETGTVTIHKLAEPETATGLANDGTEVDTAGLSSLVGVGFSIERVTSIDLSTTAGWEATDGLVAADVADADFEAVASGVTDASGTLAFGDLPLGVYLVTETSPGANQIAVTSAPFLVSVPMPTSNSTWNYDVHVYPKNSLTEISKTVDDSAAHGLGDTVSWTITAGVPEIAADDALTDFVIADQLDARLTFESATVSVGGTTLVADTDYTLTSTGGNVVVTFADARLQALAALDAASVTVVIDSTVSSIGETGDGVISNTATVYVNDPTNVFTSTPVTTSWGALEIRKVQSGDDTAMLDGARFSIYTSAADAAAGTSPVAVNGQTEFETGVDGAEGTILVEGLKAGDYWLVETAAPVGYVALSAPIEVTVAAGSLATPTVTTVENDQTPAFMLPLTGGSGTIAFVLGGIGVLLLAVGAALMQRRKARRGANA